MLILGEHRVTDFKHNSVWRRPSCASLVFSSKNPGSEARTECVIGWTVCCTPALEFLCQTEEDRLYRRRKAHCQDWQEGWGVHIFSVYSFARGYPMLLLPLCKNAHSGSKVHFDIFIFKASFWKLYQCPFITSLICVDICKRKLH